jgi:serine/threonine-protein kinase
MPAEGNGEPTELERIGCVFGGRYEIESLLGRGGMGAVFAARETTTGERVALKILRDYARFDPQILERFLQESLASAMIQHPNVVRALGAFHDDVEGPVLVLELLEGENLAEHIDRCGALPAQRALQIALQIAEGISAAHARGVIHRDLKPANVFLQAGQAARDINVRVLDFGISLLREFGQSSNAVLLGTLCYMAPEQLQSAKTPDERTDVYSLGMTLYEMLAGRTPFQETSASELLHEILFSPVPPLAERCPEVEKAVSEVVGRSVQRDPEQRYQSMQEFRAALLQLNGALGSASSDAADSRFD